MWIIIRRVWYVFVSVGAMTLWFSANTIPKAVSDADGNWATNLRYLGWENPPKALATTASDNIGVIVGIVLLVFGVICFVAWLWGKYMSDNSNDNDNDSGDGSGGITTGPNSHNLSGVFNGPVVVNPTTTTAAEKIPPARQHEAMFVMEGNNCRVTNNTGFNLRPGESLVAMRGDNNVAENNKGMRSDPDGDSKSE